MAKRILSFLIALVILVTGLFTFPVSAVENENSVTTNSEDFTVNGTSSTGNLIANALSDVQAEQEENKGYNVFSATVEDNVVLLEAETLEDCTVVVAIYDEAGTTLITSGYSPLLVGETSVVVVLETEEMPQYFYLRAFLVDSNTFRPISTSYDCPNYTQEMQEFLAKTTADFEEEKVVNFDDSIDNNFAVYDDNTIIIPEDSTGNDVTSIDDETGVYVIENADESITSLVAGDIFAYEYNEAGDILIVKVAEITIDGTTATIIGEETTLEEVFEYVKIDTTAATEDATVDTSTLMEGSTYEGVVDSSDDSGVSTYGISGEGSFNKAFAFNFVDARIGSDNAYVQVSGGLEYKVNANVKVYISWTYQYLELRIDNSLKFDLSVSAEVEGKIPLATIGFAPIPGVYIEFTPAVVIRFSAKLELSATLSMTVGFRVSNEEGMQNISTTPKVDGTIGVEGSIYVGLSLEPRVKIVHDKIASVSMAASIGAQITAATDALEVLDDSKQHDCLDECIDGDIVGVIDLSFKIKLLNMESLTWNLTLINKTFKVVDFYYSFAYDEFAFTTCPHLKYKVSLKIVDPYGKPIGTATVKGSYTTNSKGEVSFYLSDGSYDIAIAKDGYNTEVKTIKIDGKAYSGRIALTLTTGTSVLKSISLNGNHNFDDDNQIYGYSAAISSNGDLYTWGGNYYGQLGNGSYTSRNDVSTNWSPTHIMSNVKSVATGISHMAAIKNNGDLYVWGGNRDGQIGNGTYGLVLNIVETKPVPNPTYIMSNVESVSMGHNFSAAVTSNGNLYTWGLNDWGQLGNGNTNKSCRPQRIMDNVAQVSLGLSHGAAITTDGSLYMWGNNSYGQLGDGTTTNRTKPVKVLSNVAQVSAGMNYTAAITCDGTLYMWGNNSSGQLAIAFKSIVTRPTRVMKDVCSVDVGFVHSAAIKNNGDLYVWGGRSYRGLTGMIGDGKASGIQYSPKLILSNVVEVSLGNGHSAAITSDGSLYMWGGNRNGQLGNGTTSYRATPVKVMSNMKVVSPNAVATTSDFYSSNIFYADEVTETETEGKAISSKTAEFTELLPNEIYNFYVMKDRDCEIPLSAENLLYISQVISDENGGLSVTYTPTEDCDTAQVFVKGITKCDISSVSIDVYDMLYNRAQQYFDARLVYNGTFLEKGIDYEITDYQISKEIGTYTVTIKGIGDYTGSISATYDIYCGHEYCTGTCLMCGEQKGDVDGDGQFNENDYAMILSISAAMATTSDTENCDLNGDGAVDTFDAMILDLRNAGTLKSRAIGDANGDSVIDDNDYTSLSAVINEEQPITDTITELCDINSDGNIDVEDLLLLEKYLNGEYQIEQKYA